MLDAFLDWSAIFLPTLLSIAGVLVSINMPKSHHRPRWYVALIAFGMTISGVTFWQQGRSRSAHALEVTSLNSKIEGIQKETDRLVLAESAEVARRKRAEKDLTIIVQSTGKSTRDGVIRDIKESPIKVELNGVAPEPKVIPSEAERIILSKMLAIGEVGNITVATVGNVVASSVAEVIASVFREARWNVSRSSTGSLNVIVAGGGSGGRVDFEGIYLVSRNPSNPLLRTITAAFEQARHPLSASVFLRPIGDLTIYVVYGNSAR
jgi:hypothetical protein